MCIDADVRTLVLEGSNVGECADRVVQPNLEPVRFIVHVRGTLRPSGLSEVGRAVTAYGIFDSRVLERCGACLLRLHIYPLTALRLWEPAIRRGHEYAANGTVTRNSTPVGTSGVLVG